MSESKQFVVVEGLGQPVHGTLVSREVVNLKDNLAFRIVLDDAGPWDRVRTNPLGRVEVLGYSIRYVDRGPA